MRASLIAPSPVIPPRGRRRLWRTAWAAMRPRTRLMALAGAADLLVSAWCAGVIVVASAPGPNAQTMAEADSSWRIGLTIAALVITSIVVWQSARISSSDRRGELIALAAATSPGPVLLATGLRGALVALAGSVLGIPIGVFVAQAWTESFNIGWFAAWSLPLITIALVAFLGATVPAVFPLRRPPLVDLRRTTRPTPGPLAIRSIWGVALILVGAEAVTIGSQRWFSSSGITLLAGSLCVLAGSLLAVPLINRLVVRAILALLGTGMPVVIRLAAQRIGLNRLRPQDSTAVLLATTAGAVTLTGMLSTPLSPDPGLVTIWLTITGAAWVGILTATSVTLESPWLLSLRVAGMSRAQATASAGIKSLLAAVPTTVYALALGIGLSAAMAEFLEPIGGQPFSVSWPTAILLSTVLCALQVLVATVSAYQELQKPLTAMGR